MPETKTNKPTVVTTREARAKLRNILVAPTPTIIGRIYYGQIHTVRGFIVPISIDRWQKEGRRAAIAKARKQARQIIAELAAIAQN